MCLCVCVCVCVRTHMYVCVHACMHVYVSVNIALTKSTGPMYTGNDTINMVDSDNEDDDIQVMESADASQ